MAILVMVAVRDRAVDAFMRPFAVPTIGSALRSFQDEVNRTAEDNPMYKHPDDYDLFQLGTWDDNKGEFVNDLKQLALGRDMRLKEKE